MKRIFSLLTILLISGTTTLLAQTIQLSGTVKGDKTLSKGNINLSGPNVVLDNVTLSCNTFTIDINVTQITIKGNVTIKCTTFIMTGGSTSSSPIKLLGTTAQLTIDAKKHNENGRKWEITGDEDVKIIFK